MTMTCAKCLPHVCSVPGCRASDQGGADRPDREGLQGIDGDQGSIVNFRVELCYHR